MADILIKNIGGLPEDGDLTLTITPKGEIILGGCVFTHNFGKEVKAVALPSHGDLIDEDEFRLVFYREIRNHKEDEPITMILKGVLWEMDNAPVILEATE